MVNVDEAVIARLKTHGQNFEILVDCDNAIALRGGRDIEMRNVLAATRIFSDGKKGLEASENAVKQIFGTSDVEEVARQIIKKGEIQVSQEHRERMRELKRQQIIDVIHRNGVDTKTHAPHPPQRLENAMKEAGFHVDEYKPVQEQVQELLKKLKTILPIRFEIKEVSVKISPAYAPKCYSAIKHLGTILREEWQDNGYWNAVVEIPGGLESEFYEKLNKLTSGNVECKVTKIK
ncbi:ribosome assembly factor SBDS [Candidatus Woesearchaeota archaeon]|nr:ribosome assembly factor SBDS [Candidatus Woesearchaeota archaeon]